MAQFGKLSGTITDEQGNPLSGATVEVRRQGAFVTSTQAGPAYGVNDPGGIVATDQVRANALSGPSRNVSAVTATTVTTSGAGLGTLNNNDRITPFSPLPTLYADAQGAESKANPLTTDASGFWYCWAEIRPYDIIETYGSTVRLKTDLVPEGQEFVQSNVFSDASAIAYRHGTTRTLTAGKLVSLENPILVTERFSIDYAGNVVAQGNLTAVDGTFSGNLSLTGDLTVDDITADDITADDISIGDLTVSGAVSLPAGSIETADLAGNAVVATRTADGTADQTIVAAAYNTANYVDVTGATITFTPFSASSEIVIMAYSPSQAAGAAAYQWWTALLRGSTIVAEGGESVPASNPNDGPTLIYRVTGLTTSQTFKVQVQCVTANALVNNSTNAGTFRVTRIIAMEFKK